MPWHRLIGKALHDAAVHNGRWPVLIGWQVSAFKVDVCARWTGRSLERQFSCLLLVASNVRHVLPGWHLLRGSKHPTRQA